MSKKILSLEKHVLSLTIALILCLSFVPTAAFASAAAAPTAPGVAVLSDNGSYYTYILPKNVPEHDYYSEAFSTSHEFRDIFITQHGAENAAVYEMVAHIRLQMLHDDSVEYGKEIKIIGFNDIANDKVVSAANLAVCKDMPFLKTFILFGRMSSENFSGIEYILVKLADESTNDNKTYIETKNKVIDELNSYRSAVAGVTDDEIKLELVGKMFDADSVYDKSAPHEAITAILTKRGVCGSSNWAFALVGNAVGVPSYLLNVPGITHAATLVKPNGGELKVIDVTFGKRYPQVENISDWKHRDKVTWDNDAVGFKNEYYFPDVEILEHLGGLS